MQCLYRKIGSVICTIVNMVSVWFSWEHSGDDSGFSLVFFFVTYRVGFFLVLCSEGLCLVAEKTEEKKKGMCRRIQKYLLWLSFLYSNFTNKENFLPYPIFFSFYSETKQNIKVQDSKSSVWSFKLNSLSVWPYYYWIPILHILYNYRPFLLLISLMQSICHFWTTWLIFFLFLNSYLFLVLVSSFNFRHTNICQFPLIISCNLLNIFFRWKQLAKTSQ